MPLISAQTDARPEGYFRREWRLAVERTQDMADDHTFLLPVVIDDTTQARARVPEKFLMVQWTRAPGGQANASLEAACRRMFAGRDAAPEGSRQAPERPARAVPQPAAARLYPEFPREEPGQRMRFWAHVAGWLLQSAWISFKRLPRLIRAILWIWLAIAIMAKACAPWTRDSGESNAPPAPPKIPSGNTLSPADAKKLQDIADGYQGSSKTADIAKLGMQIAQTFAKEAGQEVAAAHGPVLAIPFGAPAEDASARKLADSSFAQVYGRIAISHHGHVSLLDQPLGSLDTAAAVARGREHRARYVLYGAVDQQAPAQHLTVQLLSVKDGAVLWSESYPVKGADPAAIAAQVDAKVPAANPAAEDD